ncbi:MAG: hypothetical protein AAGA54_20375 [Myxococcota bacterium]
MRGSLGGLLIACLGCAAAVSSEGSDGDSGGERSSDETVGGDASTAGEPDLGPDPIDCSTVSEASGTIGPEPFSDLRFPTRHCDPSASGADRYRCCSDDPAAPGGAPPAFEGRPIDGGAPPLFAGANNGRSRSGFCVRTSDFPAGTNLQEPEAAGCPVPCNPTWDSATAASICGQGFSCCQTRALVEADCVADGGSFRPARGSDLLDGTAPWSGGTHQDPDAVACLAAADGDPTSPTYQACATALTVANARGLCVALPPGQTCPAPPNVCETL